MGLIKLTCLANENITLIAKDLYGLFFNKAGSIPYIILKNANIYFLNSFHDFFFYQLMRQLTLNNFCEKITGRKVFIKASSIQNQILSFQMALNTAHANGGVLIHAGESILLFCDNVQMEFAGQDGVEFKGEKKGRLYLTTHRMIFNNKKQDDPMVSFSFPFVTLKDVELEQPIFGANYIKGKVRAQPGGNFTGEAKFKLHFKSGGAIDFGQAMLKAAQMASRNYNGNDLPPPYTPNIFFVRDRELLIKPASQY